MTKKATVSAGLILALCNYASEIRLEIQEVFTMLGTDLAFLRNSQERIPAAQFQALWSAIADQAGDPDFGLHLCQQSLEQPAGDILSAVMLNCPTVGQAMEKLSRYHALATDLIQVQIWEQNNIVYYGWKPASAAVKLDRQISEAVLCRISSTLQALSGGKIPLIEIHFKHPQPERTNEHQRIFPCPLIFEQPRDAILIHREDLELPIPLANPGLLQRFESIAIEMLAELYPANTWSEQVSRQISNMLLLGEKPYINAVATNLSTSTRHLQNKLKGEGTTYQTLLDQIRHKLALRYLQTPGINLFDIAFLLGYSDQSAFNHAFKRWTGGTPGEHRGGR